MEVRTRRWVLVILGALSAACFTAYGQSVIDQAIGQSLSYFRSNASRFGLSDVDRELRVRSARQQGGRVVVRFDQYYQNVRVFEGEAIAQVTNGTVSVTNALRPFIRVNTSPTVTSQTAIASAQRSVGGAGPADTTATLEILPRGSRSLIDVLVWHVHLILDNDVDEPAEWDYLIDARTGATLWNFPSLKNDAATATGKTMYSGDVQLDVTFSRSLYSLVDTIRGNGNSTRDAKDRRFGKGAVITSPTASFGNNQKDGSDRDTAGADAHYGVAATWDYYKNKLGRNGIDNQGTQTYSRVHYGRNYENAFWSDSCFCMTYGDGAATFFPLVSVDVTGHELSHGVMAAEANLTYSGESGGLNESNSDILGTMVEFNQNKPADTPEYWIGERIMQANWPGGVYTETRALRYMDDPHKDGTSPACWSTSLGSLDVHNSSGPNNHMYYLLSHGGTSKCNGNAVTGIGNDQAAQIWYEAITNWMTASTDYHAARTAALNAAGALFGAASPQRNAVAVAYSAINVN